MASIPTPKLTQLVECVARTREPGIIQPDPASSSYNEQRTTSQMHSSGENNFLHFSYQHPQDSPETTAAELNSANVIRRSTSVLACESAGLPQPSTEIVCSAQTVFNQVVPGGDSLDTYTFSRDYDFEGEIDSAGLGIDFGALNGTNVESQPIEDWNTVYIDPSRLGMWSEFRFSESGFELTLSSVFERALRKMSVEKLVAAETKESPKNPVRLSWIKSGQIPPGIEDRVVCDDSRFWGSAKQVKLFTTSLKPSIIPPNSDEANHHRGRGGRDSRSAERFRRRNYQKPYSRKSSNNTIQLSNVRQEQFCQSRFVVSGFANSRRTVLYIHSAKQRRKPNPRRLKCGQRQRKVVIW